MYSIVMLSAMSAGADVTPPANPAAVVPLATGCCGAVPVGCYGSCYGSSCHGSCHGGSFAVRSSGFLGHRTSCTGYSCFGSCNGYSHYASCYGSCRGCSGAFQYGSSWGPPIGMPPYTLHGYNSGASPVWGPGYPTTNLADPHAVYGTITNPNVTANPNRPPVMTVPVAPAPKPGSDGQPMGANLKFTLPADAKLFVDGKPAAGAGPERHFYTPPLAVGQKFFYEVKAEIMVDGKLVVEEKKIIVEAGASLTETFPKLVAAAGTSGTVAGK